MKRLQKRVKPELLRSPGSVLTLALALVFALSFTSCAPSPIQLHRFLESGSIDKLIRAVRRGANPDAVSAFGESLLSRSVEFGERDLVRVLLAAGADPDPADQWSPVEWSIRRGDLETLQSLLAAGANPNRRDYLSFAFSESSGLNSVEAGAFAEVLIENGAVAHSIQRAVETGNVDAVRVIIDSGIDVNLPYRVQGHGLTALDIAIDAVSDLTRRSDALRIAELVLAAGGKANSIDDGDWAHIVEFAPETLASAIREFVTFDNDGRIVPVLPLWKAIANDDYDEVMASVRAGADPNGYVSGYSALELAVRTFKPSAASALLDAGADPLSL